MLTRRTALGAIAAGTASCVRTERLQRRPNLVFIIADDHRWDVMGAAGNAKAQTPNLDRLAASGVRFANHYVNYPLCTPSRQSVFTGMLPHASGVSTFGTALSEDRRTTAEQLKDAGYRTAAFGKMGFMQDAYPGMHGLEVAEVEGAMTWRQDVQPRPPEPGVKTKPRARAHQDPTRDWLNCDYLPAPYYAEDMPSRHTARKAIEYLEQQGAEPFALWVSFPEPHNPFDFPIDYAGRHNPADFELPPMGPDDAPNVPLILRELTDDDMRGTLASYYTSASFLDENVGLVTDTLARLGLDDNTLVVYWGDHGFLLGEHGRIYKHCLYEPALRVPMLMSCPGRVASAVVEDFTESVDIPATILDFLGVDPIPAMQGRSLKPYLEDGKSDSPRDHIFSEFLHNEEACVRTARWKFTHCTGKRFRNDGYETDDPTPGRYVRLYDVQADPGELHDVAAANPTVVGEMSELLLARFRQTHPEASDEPAGELPDILDWYLRPRDESRGM